MEWLQDPEYEPASCSICKDPITDDNVLRLMCLHLFHPECIDVHAASFPPNTAQAGFTCPTCTKPIIPPAGATSPLARLLQQHLQTAPWLHPAEQVVPNDSPRLDKTRKFSRENDVQDDVVIDIPEGIAARKSLKAASSSKSIDIESNEPFDDDDDKYRKHSVNQILGLLSKEEPAPGKKKVASFRLTSRRVLILFGLLSILCTIIFLHKSLSAMP